MSRRRSLRNRARPQASAERVPQAALNRHGAYRVPKNADSFDGLPDKHHIVFRFDCVDIEADCPWSLADITQTDHVTLLRKLREFECCTLSEILSPSYKAFHLYTNCSDCPNRKAVRRLGERYECDSDAIARFRLGGTERLYGFLVGHEFHILWWDKDHEIWPSRKKNT